MTPDSIAERDREEAAALRAEWLQYRAQLHDPETGLPTLATVVDELRRRLEEGARLSVFSLSLHAERQVEESWGWQAYDRLVVEFIRSLREDRGQGAVPDGLLCLPAVRSDEILLFVASPKQPDDAPTFLARQSEDLDEYIRAFLAARVPASDPFTSFVGSSAVVFDPKVRIERLIYRGVREARLAVAARNARSETRGAEVLRQIIAQGAILPMFQPILDLSTRSVIAFEALSRGPQGSGFEEGEALFSFAERANLLLPLERICRRRILEEAGGIPAHQLLFVNISPAATNDADFLDGAFERAVRRAKIEPARIVIEITERTYAHQQDVFRSVIAGLRGSGFRIAVDDMGTGYSSFSSLAEIAPDFLKFDSVFVHEIDRHRIKRDLLDAMISFARKSGTRVIAEGVETPEELATLIELGVPYGQGFFLGRPDVLERHLPIPGD